MPVHTPSDVGRVWGVQPAARHHDRKGTCPRAGPERGGWRPNPAEKEL